MIRVESEGGGGRKRRIDKHGGEPEHVSKKIAGSVWPRG